MLQNRNIGLVIMIFKDFLCFSSYLVFPDGGCPNAAAFSASLWDRHFGVCVASLIHGQRVASAAVEPARQAAAATASEDMTVKIWRSREAIARMQTRSKL